MRQMKRALVVALIAFGLVPVALAAQSAGTISTAGATLRVPAGWHAKIAKTPKCDPERLIVVSNAPLRISTEGQIAEPNVGEVVILLLEDNKVTPNLSVLRGRPDHFTVAWKGLVSLNPANFCGNPNAPASMRYFKTHGRYLGFIVYPGVKVSAQTRAKTVGVMNSLRVNP